MARKPGKPYNRQRRRMVARRWNRYSAKQLANERRPCRQDPPRPCSCPGGDLECGSRRVGPRYLQSDDGGYTPSVYRRREHNAKLADGRRARRAERKQNR